MSNYQRTRPAEWLHSKQCLAEALIAAIQNLRDDPEETDLEFRVAMQDNYELEIADEYLRDGLMTCTCPQPWLCDLCRTALDHPNDTHPCVEDDEYDPTYLAAGDGSANAYFVDRQLGDLGGRS